MGPPPEGALNMSAWRMIREMVGADPALTAAAWHDLQEVAGLLPVPADGNPEPVRRIAGGSFEF